MRMVALAEIAAITAGQSPPGSTYNEVGEGLPFFQGKADFGTSHPTARKWCTAPKKIAEAGDILLSVRAPVGPTNIAAERCCIGRGLAAIRPDDQATLPGFLHWVLKHRRPELAAKATGSTFTAVGQGDLRSLLVPLPPLVEQRRIVDILNRAAGIEILGRQADERLREFAPALFYQMFGDPVENPMGWEVRSLANLVQEFRYGTSRKCYDAAQSEDALPVLRIPNVLHGGVDWTNLKFTSLRGEERQKLKLARGDILFVRTNGNPEYIGRCAVFSGCREAAYASYLIRARLNRPEAVDPEYVAAGLALPTMRQILLRLTRTTAGNYNISIDLLGRIRIPLPPLVLQRRYAEMTNAAGALVPAGESRTRAPVELLESLMSRLLQDSSASHGGRSVAGDKNGTAARRRRAPAVRA